MSWGTTFASACLLAFGVLALGPTPATAKRRLKTSPTERAELLNRSGKAAFRAGKLDDALTAFQAAWELHPQPKYLYNLARTREERGDLYQAMAAYNQYLVECPDAEDTARVEGHIDFLRVKAARSLARVEVETKPPGALLRLALDDLVVDGTTPWQGHLPPGLWTVTVTAPGHAPVEREVVAAVGQAARVEVTIEPEPEPEAPKARSSPAKVLLPPEVAAEEPGLAPVVALAAAGVAVVGGVVLGLLATSRGEELDGYLSDRQAEGHTRAGAEELASSTDTLALAANLSFVAAAAVGLGGALLWQVSADEAGARVVWTW